MDELSSLPQADQDAIGVTLMALLSGFQERNADKLANVYSADADWVNAFGSVKRGSDQIVEYLRGLFADDNRPTPASVCSVPRSSLSTPTCRSRARSWSAGVRSKFGTTTPCACSSASLMGLGSSCPRCTTTPTRKAPTKATLDGALRNTGYGPPVLTLEPEPSQSAWLGTEYHGHRMWLDSEYAPRRWSL